MVAKTDQSMRPQQEMTPSISSKIFDAMRNNPEITAIGAIALAGATLHHTGAADYLFSTPKEYVFKILADNPKTPTSPYGLTVLTVLANKVGSFALATGNVIMQHPVVATTALATTAGLAGCANVFAYSAVGSGI